MPQPNEQALRRYPNTGGTYTPATQDAEPITCTCKAGCATPCRGECGCRACEAAFEDWDGFGRTEY